MVGVMKALGAMVLAVAACGPSVRDRDGGGIDAGSSGDGGSTVDASAGQTYVYAHSSSALYRVDPITLAVNLVGDFQYAAALPDQMTDLAIDKTGLMIGVSFTSVYQVDPTTAVTTKLSDGLTGTFNGLSFVPAEQVGRTGADVLVGTRNADGAVFEINPMTGVATMIGNMGSYSSSGDLVAVKDFGTVLTADNGTSNDRLVRLAPQSFAATLIGADIGYAEIWGIAFWGDKIFGFTNAGQFITIDPMTGTGTVVQMNGPAWWGAAVTTSAPVIF